MNKYFSFFAVFSVLMSATSCMNSYNIEGSSDISGLDSRMMYLSTIGDNQLKNLDSTEVVHGKFGFTGTTDSVRIAFLTFGNNGNLPIVLEGGDIFVRVNNKKREWGGTPYNDKLYTFVNVLDSLNMELVELDHEQTRAFMDGEDMNVVGANLQRQAQTILVRIDSLVTNSISENFDNVLGPGFFMLSTLGRYPEMSPWVMELMSKATDSFKNDPYVKDYISRAQYLQNVNNGLEAPPTASRAGNNVPPPSSGEGESPAPTATVAPPSAPTPADLAKPAPEAIGDTVAAATP